MPRPKNRSEIEIVRIRVSRRFWEWLEELADYSVYGRTPTAVAERFVEDGINRELKGEGYLKLPPPYPRKRKARG